MANAEAFEQVRSISLAGKADVCGDREVREEAIILREVASATAFCAEVNPPVGVEPDFAAQRDASGVRVFKAGDGSEQRGLAGA